jgi:cell division protein FtsI (penicillin-binding protein 3)/stage V sporulation protein D (sporulation-specific penicillin-binding protein)
MLVAGLVLYRLFILSYVRHGDYERTAIAQKDSVTNILARGNIYFQDLKSSSTVGQDGLFLAATNKKFPLLQANPSLIMKNDIDKISGELASILAIDKEKIRTSIDSDSNKYKVLHRRLSTEEVEKIKSLKVDGLSIAYETDRFYPGGNLGSDILGFLGYNQDGNKSGQYGIEEYYNEILYGKPEVSGSSGSSGPVSIFKRWFSGTSDETGESIRRPADLVLTIDKNIQSYAESVLAGVLKKWNAEKGTIIIEDPTTGRILAMADGPSFDPNYYSEAETRVFLSGSTQETFEPGSSFKPITMAAGLDLVKITPDTLFTDTGSVTIGGFTIKNFSDKIFGTVTMSQILEKSINTGVMHVENLIGDEAFLDYVINMGFGQKTDIDMPGELHGDITNLYSGRKINYSTASFGQGIAVTPIQLINAYAAIANGGKLMRPYIVEKIVREGGTAEVTKPSIVGIPISEKTATKLQTMLVSVVDKGFDKARIKGYDIAGKTGTAQISDSGGGYQDNVFIHDFLGFAPGYNAKFVVLIKMDKPKGVTFASDSLSSTYREIASFLINYFNIPPTR